MAINDSKLETYLNSLTEETTPETTADMLLMLDNSESIMKKIKIGTISSGEGTGGIGGAGWDSANALTYSSTDGHTFVVTCTGDQSAKYSPGMRIKLTDSTVKYFIITKVVYTSSTAITLYGGTDYTLTGGAITNPYYSSAKAPAGFPLSPSKWVESASYSSLADQASPTINVWYNVGSLSLAVPIGAWRVLYKCEIDDRQAGASGVNAYTTLSTANNSASDADFTVAGPGTGISTQTDMYAYMTTEKYLLLDSKTTYYLNLMTDCSGQTHLYLRGDMAVATIFAFCAYL
jgi:hypothetical protein